MTAPVDVCNWALLRLGQARVSSIDPPFTTDPAGIAATCSFLYPLVRDAELRAHAWTFAKARVQIAAEIDAPEFGYAHKYRKPADFARLVAAPDDAGQEADLLPEGEFILSDLPAPLDCVYVRTGVDASEFDPLFTAALSCSLALNLAEKITTSPAKKESIDKDYGRIVSQAKLTNSIEQPAQKPPEDDFVLVRR
ncbi:MAG: hypothetical protein Q8P46_06975 [Hyphomicrobiales bacterium]|nr:hypothetical protein [Hyphomicrobiales bacterium]